MENSKIQILIIDLGSQYTKVIKRSLRYLGFRSTILSPFESLEYAHNNQLRGIILSGGSSSVYDVDAPIVPKELLNLNIPILGICYGMQWLAYTYDKDSIQNKKEAKSYGATLVNLDKNKKSKLFENLYEKNDGNINAWASHGDSLKKVPNDFEIIASSSGGLVIEAMENTNKNLYGVEFHPEVEETEDENVILHNFMKICNVEMDYSKEDIIEEIRENTKKELGDGVAIIGVSGGVDSTTLAAILAPALGSQLKAFIIDTGGMRKGEIEKVRDLMQKSKINFEVIDKYKNKFIESIGTTIDAEEKRAKFREVYGEVFRDVAKSYNATHMIQGTLATDLIESGSGGKSAMIKTHHNVDLNLGLKEIMPLSDYFKFEVRKLAFEFGLDELISQRQPFPGPGLYLRIIGVPVNEELLDIVREADLEVADILKKYNLYNKISQTIVALFGIKTVGVKGDGRVYGYSLVVRTVATTDFMTVKGFYLPKEVCEEIISTLSRYPNIVRILFDYTSKPPATTEFE